MGACHKQQCFTTCAHALGVFHLGRQLDDQCIQTTSEKASALQCEQKRSSKQTAMRRNSSRRKQAVQHCRTDESKLQAVQHCLKHGSGVQHCCILCYVPDGRNKGEADVAQELIIFAHTAGAAVGTKFHATLLTLAQIRQGARFATQPAAGGIT